MTLKLYRAVPVRDVSPVGRRYVRRPDVRLPANVPYVVDNLWEALRPWDMPCRRHAVYASPTPELALESMASTEPGIAYELRFDGPVKVAQLQVPDAKLHPDLRAIRALLQQRAKALEAALWAERQRAAMLFMPGASADDWARAVDENAWASEFAAEARAMSTFWTHASTSPSLTAGELFIELMEGGSYTLHTIDRPYFCKP